MNNTHKNTDNHHVDKKNSIILDSIAGWCSGVVAIICCQPLDTMLTRYQADRSRPTLFSTIYQTTATTPATTPIAIASSSPITFMKFQNWLQLWRGSIPMMSAVPFQNALLMAGYGIGKRWGEQQQQENGQGSTNSIFKSSKYIPIFIGGCTGGILQSFLMSPVEWIKVQRQVHSVQPIVAVEAAAAAAVSATITTTTSTTLFWSFLRHPTRGLGATLLRDGIPHGVWFVAYDWAKTNWTFLDQGRSRKRKDSTGIHMVPMEPDPMLVPLGAGAFAATVAWVRTYGRMVGWLVGWFVCVCVCVCVCLMMMYFFMTCVSSAK
jgi:solute carrier family 25 (mitochondrial carnitine/acylcarnitine transporter), member 20/29